MARSKALSPTAVTTLQNVISDIENISSYAGEVISEETARFESERHGIREFYRRLRAVKNSADVLKAYYELMNSSTKFMVLEGGKMRAAMPDEVFKTVISADELTKGAR